MLELKLYFGGGLEALVDGKRKITVEIAIEKIQIEVTELFEWILTNLLKNCSKTEDLILNGDVRPGVLLLINDADYEILGGVGYFISLLLKATKFTKSVLIWFPQIFSISFSLISFFVI